MSAISSFNNRRNVWLNHHKNPLRKQRSLTEETLTSSSLSSTSITKVISIKSSTDSVSQSQLQQDQQQKYHNKNNTDIKNSNNLNITKRSNCKKFSILQKQFSLDQAYGTKSFRQQQQQRKLYDHNCSVNNNNNNNKFINENINNYNLKKHYNTLAIINKNKTNSLHLKSSDSILNNNQSSNNIKSVNGVNSSSSLSSSSSNIITIKKKTTSIDKGYGLDTRKDNKSFNEKTVKKSNQKTEKDDRVNLNIFIGNSKLDNDNDELDSDNESNSENDDCNLMNRESSKSSLEKSNKISSNTRKLARPSSLINSSNSTIVNRGTEKNTCNTANINNNNFNNSTNAIISANTTANNHQPNVIISAAPSLTIERRPPLIRTMSAPVRSLHENSKNIIANKRKPRRRKFLTRSTTISDNRSLNEENSDTNLDENNEKLIGENFSSKCNNFNENHNNKNNTITNSNNRKTINKVKGTIGCDVVTLVSLISSEGSDSEKEDIAHQISVITGIETQTKRAPFLRKTGKSVSFQDDDISLLKNTNTKETSHTLRRGSLAPLAARIRSNRPPTAPPVPIFISETKTSNIKMTNRENSNSKENISNHQDMNRKYNDETLSSLKNNGLMNIDSISTITMTSDTTIEYQFPDYVRSSKERECWKLFMKMTKKGVSVTYDTILRGMLTPTELRLIQKQQNELELINKKAEEEEEEQQKFDENEKLKEKHLLSNNVLGKKIK